MFFPFLSVFCLGICHRTGSPAGVLDMRSSRTAFPSLLFCLFFARTPHSEDICTRRMHGGCQLDFSKSILWALERRWTRPRDFQHPDYSEARSGSPILPHQNPKKLIYGKLEQKVLVFSTAISFSRASDNEGKTHERGTHRCTSFSRAGVES